MYRRWAEKQDFVCKELDCNRGDVGYRSISLQIKGEYAYGWAQYESGVHRRICHSKYDASGKRHTSFASVQVIPSAPADKSMEIEINPRDLKIEVMRSQGAGGQHVNKTESAVRLTHLPTNTVAFVISLLTSVKMKDLRLETNR